MACGVPIFMTNTGHTAEVLANHNAGRIVQKKDYKGWKKEIELILKGAKISTIPLELVKGYYSWENIAIKYIEFYRSVI
jgi:glycosyltransferase involved in cell wall biosynthesis